MSKKIKTCIIIPAFNEQETLGKVIDNLKKIDRQYHLVVVNDGSIDKTRQVAEAKKVVVLNLPFNLGIGGSVQTGLKYAFDHGFDLAVQVDGDGQHDQAMVPKLIKAWQRSKADLVIGSRYFKKTGYKAFWIRRLGVVIFSLLTRLVTGRTIYDCTSGFRVFPRKTMAFFCKNYPIDFPEPESIVKLLKHGFFIKEIPVVMQKRHYGRSSVTAFKAIFFMLSISLSIIIEGLKEHNQYKL